MEQLVLQYGTTFIVIVATIALIGIIVGLTLDNGIVKNTLLQFFTELFNSTKIQN